MRPLRVIAVSWMVGVGIARLCEGTPLALVGYALGLALAGLALLWVRRSGIGLALYACGVAAWVALPAPRLTPLVADGREHVLVARVDGTPVERERVSVPVVLEDARDEDALVGVAGRVLLTTTRARLAPDEELLVRGHVSPPSRTCNFGACDGPWRAAAEGLDGMMFVRGTELARIEMVTGGLRAALWRLRLAMRAEIVRTLPEAEAMLVAALVLGDRGGLGDELEASFRAVGITHLLSVSGLHLAFVAGLLFGALRWLLARGWPSLGRSHPRDRWAALLALPLVALYALLVGAEVATVRAALVAGYAFFALIACRRLRGADALAFAALVLLGPRPAYLFDVSFELSFVSALALLAVPKVTTTSRLRSIVTIALASLGATLATAPLTATWFSQIAPMGVVSNAIAIPLTELLLVPLGIAGALISLVVPVLGHVVLHASGFCAYLLLRFVALLAPLSPVWSLPSPSLLTLVACAVALLWVARAPGLLRTLKALAMIAAIVLAQHGFVRLRARIEIVFLDVGQGDGAVIVTPSNEAVVIDGGPDPAGRAVLHELRRRGVGRVRLVVLSHPHPDHAGGLAAVLDAFPVDAVWTNGQDSAEPSTRALYAAAARHGVAIERPHPLELGGAALVPVALPEAPDLLASDNDNSLVLRLDYGGHAVLFAGDIEEAAEQRIVRAGLAPVDVLKVPHHGSRTSSTDELLDALRPSFAVASLAYDNRYRFPHPDVVARYRERNVALYRTDRDGAVEIDLGPHGGLVIDCARPGGCTP